MKQHPTSPPPQANKNGIKLKIEDTSGNFVLTDLTPIGIWPKI
jgi:hypothetical protein